MDSSEYCLKASLNCGNAWENVCQALSQGSFFICNQHVLSKHRKRAINILTNCLQLVGNTCWSSFAALPLWPFNYLLYTQSTYYKILVIVSSMFYSMWRGCTYGGVYVPCIYSLARWEIQEATQVFVVVLVLRISSANSLPCVLILHKRSGPHLTFIRSWNQMHSWFIYFLNLKMFLHSFMTLWFWTGFPIFCHQHWRIT